MEATSTDPEWSGDLKPAEPAELGRMFGPRDCQEYVYDWVHHAHPGQLPPPDADGVRYLKIPVTLAA